MNQTEKQQAAEKVKALVTKSQGLTATEIRHYQEANTKAEFIEPLFQALGWSVHDALEVSREEGASKGRVDYAFNFSGVPRFYLEAKPLRSNLDNQEWIRQAITYAYNKGVTWVILTNFRNLWVFNAQGESRTTADARFLALNDKDFLSDFDNLWLLSKDSVQQSLLEEAARKVGKLPTALPVEKRLFSQLRTWREELFNEIHHYHTGWKFSQIDEVIQRLFNRLIFIRTCEDRALETRHLLSALHEWRSSGKKPPLLERLRQIFKIFDGYYDSDLFALHLCDQAFLEDPTLENIIQGLYDAPGGLAQYDFSLIDADVLGQVYEQYLGHIAQVVVRRAKEAQIRMELGVPTDEIEITAKKERRKEQGIYYTPKWVVDYIVRQTVGRYIREHNYNDILNIKILDPACGSGSFLIRAYDELLRYHAKVRSKDVNEMEWQDRLPVLLNSICGVDLDQQAVEIARLNLLLRALARREVLPPLSDNIKRGNSLVSGGEKELKPYFGDSWRNKHPFNWEQEFQNIMSEGGFDIVIGNPPYVGFQGFEEDKSYLKVIYSCATGRFDVYMPFLERGLDLLKPGGLLGFICPTNFMKREHGQRLRTLLRSNATVETIVDFEHSQVFEEAVNYTCILILRKDTPPSEHNIEYWPGGITAKSFPIQQTTLDDQGWAFVPPNQRGLFDKLAEKEPLKNFVTGIYEGIVTGANRVFLLPTEVAGALRLEKELIKPAIQGKHINRWYLEPLSHVLLYPYRDQNGKSLAPDEDVLRNDFPRICHYLDSERRSLVGRGYFERSGKRWFELWNERSFDKQATTKIVVQEIAQRAEFTLSTPDQFYLDTTCGIIPKSLSHHETLYLLALLNSKLLDWYYKCTTVPKAGGFYIYKTMFLERLPICRLDPGKPGEKTRYDRIVRLAEQMLELQRRLAVKEGINDTEAEDLKHQIALTDREIDGLVYDLYGLTEQERRIVEGSA